MGRNFEKNMKPLTLFTPFLPLFSCNIYLQSPRGSNNRLNEKSAQNENYKRLFNSENNRRGGYNVGDSTNAPFKTENEQFSMSYFMGSELTVEWTNSIGCGVDEDGDRINNCEVVLQSLCQDDNVETSENSWRLRNGVKTDTIGFSESSLENENRSQKNERRKVPVNSDLGMHESWEFF